MISEAGAQFKQIVREQISPGFTAAHDYLAQRAALRAMSEGAVLPEDITITEETLGGVMCEWVTDPKSKDDRILIHVHGGGGRIGDPFCYRGMASNLVKATKAKLLVPDYQLVPENRFPCGSEDTLAVFEALLEQGISPENIMMSGDSGGAAILLTTLLMLKEKELPMPKAVMLMSPMTDSTCFGETYATQKENDPWLTPEVMYVVWKQYAPDLDPKLPMVSPVFADLADLPPMLIQVGSHEILLDDSRMLAEKAEEDGIDVTLTVYEEMWHVFQFFGPTFPEGEAAFKEIGTFAKTHLSKKESVAN